MSVPARGNDYGSSWKMTDRASPRRTERAYYNAACARIRTCPGTVWGWRWFTTPWTCTVARSLSTPRLWAERVSRYVCPGGEPDGGGLRRDFELDSLRDRKSTRL